MKLEELIRVLEVSPRIIITSHEFADADGLGAEYALGRALLSLGKDVRIINTEAPAPKFSFIDQRGIIETFKPAEKLRVDDTVLLIMDTNDTRFIGRLADACLGKVARHIIIDHHDSEEGSPTVSYVETNTASTCEIIHKLLVKMGLDIELDMAEALFAGIVYDTGSFIYPKVTAKTFKCALELVSRGVKPTLIHNLMYESSLIGVLMLRKKVFATLELFSGNRVAVQSLCKEDLLESGATYEDAEDFINMPLSCKEVEISVLFKETPEGMLRCSLRSKGRVNVADIAENLGGGGHRTAAGFRCYKPLEQMRPIVLETLNAYIG